MKKTAIITAQAVTKGPKHHFFGYYDKCPWSQNGRLLLSMETDFNDHFPCGEQAAISLIDLRDRGKLTILGYTRAWNWQQGAMLQWLPSNPNQNVIFNNIISNQLVSTILDIKTTASITLPKPIAAIDPVGKTALSLNFGRLYDMRKAYGYHGVTDPWFKEMHPVDDGIYSMDVKSGNYRLIVSLDKIACFESATTRHDVKHWINHLSFNPDGSRFCFLHRFEIPEINHFGTRLFTARSDGSDLRCLWRGHISHFDWFNKEHLLAWVASQRGIIKNNRISTIGARFLKKHPFLRKIIKQIPLVKQRFIGGHFVLIKDCSSEHTLFDTIGNTILTEDGHCTYSPDRQWILMDLYPNLLNHRTLLMYNTKHGQRIDIGKFHSPSQLREEIRCDLHARWSRDGELICIDSAHEGMRQMYLIDVTPILNQM